MSGAQVSSSNICWRLKQFFSSSILRHTSVEPRLEPCRSSGFLFWIGHFVVTRLYGKQASAASSSAASCCFSAARRVRSAFCRSQGRQTRQVCGPNLTGDPTFERVDRPFLAILKPLRPFLVLAAAVVFLIYGLKSLFTQSGGTSYVERRH